MRFTKMQGTGNDYIYLDGIDDPPEHPADLAVRLSRPHFGVGSDGLILLLPSDRADVRMAMFNADGSEGAMCGNGLRCLAKFAFDRGRTRKKTITVETPAGLRTATLHTEGGREARVTVDMGAPALGRDMVLDVAGVRYDVTPVSMGNPHAVIFLNDIDALDLPRLGPLFEHHSAFAPGRVNTEFVAVRSPQRLSLRVWERGSGETLSCGTGACAALAAAVRAGHCARCGEALLPGGTLSLRWDERDGHIYLTGDAVTVFEGEVYL